MNIYILFYKYINIYAHIYIYIIKIYKYIYILYMPVFCLPAMAKRKVSFTVIINIQTLIRN